MDDYEIQYKKNAATLAAERTLYYQNKNGYKFIIVRGYDGLPFIRRDYVRYNVKPDSVQAYYEESGGNHGRDLYMIDVSEDDLFETKEEANEDLKIRYDKLEKEYVEKLIKIKNARERNLT